MDTAYWMPIVLTFLAGILVGWGAAYAFGVLQARTAKDLADTWFREHEDQLKASFGNLSLSALSRSTEEFLKLAKAKLDSEREVGAKDLDSKKALIDQQLQQMTVELEKVSRLVSDLERDRVEKFGELTTQLKNQTEQTSALIQTATSLREALSSTKARGQWGERMAEDVLRLAGLIENINYVKQRALEGSGGRPDFTFLLPRNLKLNMDVKFPLDNYLRYVEAASETDRGKYRTEFLRDVRARIKEVTTRDYIDPEQGTVDSVLVFIPNEQIYAFIHEQDSSILDDAIRHGVVLCSPLTLFAILAVIRKAIDNFTLEQTSNEILSLLGAFKKQWDAFVSKLEVLGRRIGDAQREYEAITSTRRRQLEKPLQRLEDIRTQRGLPVTADEDGEPPALIRREDAEEESHV